MNVTIFIWYFHNGEITLLFFAKYMVDQTAVVEPSYYDRIFGTRTKHNFTFTAEIACHRQILVYLSMNSFPTPALRPYTPTTMAPVTSIISRNNNVRKTGSCGTHLPNRSDTDENIQTVQS